MLSRIFLAPTDAGGQDQPTPSAPAEVESQAGQAPENTEPVQSKPFFEIEDEKGKKYSFKTPEELSAAWKQSGMLRSDYDRKRQAEAAERRKWEAERDAKMKEFEELDRRYQSFNRFLKERPDVYRMLEQAMSRPISPDGIVQRAQSYADEKASEIQKKLEELEAWKRQQELAAEKARVFEGMKKRFEDFDEKAIEEQLASLGEPSLEGLVELLYYSGRGRMSPAEIERKLAERQAIKQQGRMMPGSGSAPAEKTASSLDEAAEIAKRQARARR